MPIGPSGVGVIEGYSYKQRVFTSDSAEWTDWECKDMTTT
jgi:hypothetical protein